MALARIARFLGQSQIWRLVSDPKGGQGLELAASPGPVESAAVAVVHAAIKPATETSLCPTADAALRIHTHRPDLAAAVTRV